MNNSLIETFKHAGLTVEIHADHDYNESPDEWCDEEVFLVAFSHREFWVQRDGFGLEDIRSALKISDPTERSREINKQYHVFGLEAYIHSQVTLAISYEGSFPDRRWDVSQLGAVLVRRKRGLTRAKAKKLAEGLIDTWNMCLHGEVYGYIIKDENGEDLHGDLIDSCWGYLGNTAVTEAAKEAAECVAKSIKQRKTKKLKTYITHKVPLEKRDLSLA